VKPEATNYLAKARQCLDEARQIAALMQLHHIVAREAYLAGLSRCRGVHLRAHRQDREDAPWLTEQIRSIGAKRAVHRPRVPDLPRRSLRVKSIANYGVSTTTTPTTAEDPSSAIDTAGRLIECIAELLS
jgi:hypothetical protein